MTLVGMRWAVDRYSSSLRDRGRKLIWRVRNSTKHVCTPIFIIGSQRSGTGMLGECLGHSPEFENLGESDPRAFDHFSLKDDVVVSNLIKECKYPYLVFKPLKDSHRVRELLALHPASKGLWAFRNYMDRINSAVRQFGRHPLDVFASLAGGNRNHWQLQGMSENVESVVRSFRPAELTLQDGAALMWWVRNSLYFDQCLSAATNVRLWSYDAFVRNPARELGSLLEFVGGQFHEYMLVGVHARSVRKDPVPQLRTDVRELCRLLFERLEQASAEQSSH